MKHILLVVFLLLPLQCSHTSRPADSGSSAPEPVHAQVESPSPQESAVTPSESQQTEVDSLTREVQVFFQHALFDNLVTVKREIIVSVPPEDQIKQVIDHLTIAPDPMDGRQLWPSSMFTREVYVVGFDTVVVDLDGSFRSRVSAGTTYEELMVFSLVHSILDNFPDFKEIYLLLDGRLEETLLGQVDIERPLTSKPDLLFQEDTAVEEEVDVEAL